ncbi:MAG: sialidase family protein [Polyangiaceae bacterium]
MKTSFAWISGVCAAVLSLSSAGCDGGGDGTGGNAGAGGSTGGTGGTTSPAGGGGTGGTGTTSMGGTGGTGTTSMGMPFTSKGDSSYETQTSLAADDQGGVVAVWIAFFADNTSGIGYAVSRDGGDTWTAPSVVKSPDGRLASNPVVVADSKGVFSLAWLGFRVDGNGPDEHIYVSHLDNGTDTFGAPIIASDDGTKTTLDFDKPGMKVGPADELLLTWADFSATANGGPANLTFARSTNGTDFTKSIITSDATFGNLASLCVDLSDPAVGAPLHLVHLGANGTVTLRTSTDDGANWTLKSTPATMTLFQDITCAAFGKDLWIAYASGTALFSPTEDSPADAVMVMHSSSGGTNFDTPVDVTNGAQGEQFLFPQLVRAASGKLGVVYYQGVVDGNAQLVLASSADGKTWTTSPIAASGKLTIDRTIASWLGAYVGFAIQANGLVSYADNSENKSHIKFAQIALP